MSSQANPFITPTEYLEIERKAEFKSEYYQGQMFAMAGVREPHAMIVTNLTIELGTQLIPRSCRVYSNDMRVHVPATGLYTYPDVIAVCEKPEFLDGVFDTLLNPVFLCEVLSPSTEAYDRGRKFEHYASLPSLREYLLLASDRMHADLFRRQPGGEWTWRAFSEAEALLEFESLACRVRLGELYQLVDFTRS